MRLQTSAALPAAAFSPEVHRTPVFSRELQVFGVRVGVSVRAWVQWEAVREVCVGRYGWRVLGKHGTRNASNRRASNSRPLRQVRCRIVLSRVAKRKPVVPRAPG